MRERFPYVNCVSTTDHYLVERALLVALDRWVGEDAAPPASAYPHVADGTPVTPEQYRAHFPPDADGNDRSGVRMVGLQAPLGTHTGWDGRDPATGFAWATARFDGSFLPFARTEAERKVAGDPRPSLELRYRDEAAYARAARAAALRQVAAGFLLP